MSLIGLVLAHHADHARPVPARDLHRGLADLAVDAHHQHGLAGHRDSGAPKTFHRGDEGHADAGRLFPGNAVRLVDDRLELDGQMRRMCAVAANAEIAGGAEYLAPDRARRAVDHHAGIVAAGRAREYRIRHQPGRGLHVGWIDGCGLELDQQVIFAARQRVRLDNR